MTKLIYLYLLDTMADWEVGLIISELNSRRFLTPKFEYQVKTFTLDKMPITTMGGLKMVPDQGIDEVNISEAALLILPGAEIWMQPAQNAVLDKARDFLAAEVPVAAICGATVAMANAGMLDQVQHTSNSLGYLQMICPNYHGEALYKADLAVTDGNLITAGSSSAVEFAYHILKKLEAMKPDSLEHWYNYFGRHSEVALFQLFESLPRKSNG